MTSPPSRQPSAYRWRLPAPEQLTRLAHVPVFVLARLLTAFAGFLMVWRLSPQAVGGYHYLQATVAIPISLFALSLDVSMNTLLSRRRADGLPLAPTLLAGALVVALGTIASVATVALLLLERNAAVEPPVLAGALLVATCATTFSNLLLNGISYSLGAFKHVAIAGLATGVAMMAAVLAVSASVSAQALLAIFASATAFGVLVQSSMLLRLVGTNRLTSRLRSARAEMPAQLRLLLAFGSKQAMVTSALFGTLWIIQAELTANRGLAGTALYGLGNQLYNLVIFFPSIANPMILQAMASTRRDAAGQRKLGLRLTFFFAALVGCACMAAAITLPFVEGWLQASYAGLPIVGTLAVAAAGAQLIRTPLSMHFSSALRASQDLWAAGALVVTALAGLMLLPALTPASAMTLRVVGQIAATAVLLLLFLRDTRHPPVPD